MFDSSSACLNLVWKMLATKANIPMIATTTTSSSSEKPIVIWTVKYLQVFVVSHEAFVWLALLPRQRVAGMIWSVVLC